MYCIISYGFSKKYLIFQSDGEGGGLSHAYCLADKNTFLMNLLNHSKRHPVIFKTEDAARDFIKWLELKRPGFTREFTVEYVNSYEIPTCKDTDCWKCNKNHINSCKHLRNKYQNLCSFKMAKFPEDFKLEEGRLDASCEKCLTYGCIYNMNGETDYE